MVGTKPTVLPLLRAARDHARMEAGESMIGNERHELLLQKKC